MYPEWFLFWSKEAIQRFAEIVTQIAFVPQKGFQLPKKNIILSLKCTPSVPQMCLPKLPNCRYAHQWTSHQLKNLSPLNTL